MTGYDSDLSTYEPDRPKGPIKYCRCAHMEAAHYDLTEVETNYGLTTVFKTSYRCRFKNCTCTEFRPKKRKNRIKHFFTGRG